MILGFYLFCRKPPYDLNINLNVPAMSKILECRVAEFLTIGLKVVDGDTEEYKHNFTFRVDGYSALFCPVCGLSISNKLDYITHVKQHATVQSSKNTKPMPQLQSVQEGKVGKRQHSDKNPVVALSDIMVDTLDQQFLKQPRLENNSSGHEPSELNNSNLSRLGNQTVLSCLQMHSSPKQRLTPLSFEELTPISYGLNSSISRALSEISDFSDLQSLPSDTCGSSLQDSSIFFDATNQNISADSEKKTLVVNLQRLPDDVVKKFKHPLVLQPPAQFTLQSRVSSGSILHVQKQTEEPSDKQSSYLTTGSNSSKVHLKMQQCLIF